MAFIWMKILSSLHDYHLHHTFQHILRLKSYFSHIYFDHVFNNQNKTTYALSKEGLSMEKGAWKMIKSKMNPNLKIYMNAGSA